MPNYRLAIHKIKICDAYAMFAFRKYGNDSIIIPFEIRVYQCAVDHVFLYTKTRDRLILKETKILPRNLIRKKVNAMLNDPEIDCRITKSIVCNRQFEIINNKIGYPHLGFFMELINFLRELGGFDRKVESIIFYGCGHCLPRCVSCNK
jgi:hypothetical protein